MKTIQQDTGIMREKLKPNITPHLQIWHQYKHKKNINSSRHDKIKQLGLKGE